jgi:hypothetical protein
MATVRIVDADKEDRRQRVVVITLFALGILGISYLVYDYVRIINHVALPAPMEWGNGLAEEKVMLRGGRGIGWASRR